MSPSENASANTVRNPTRQKGLRYSSVQTISHAERRTPHVSSRTAFSTVMIDERRFIDEMHFEVWQIGWMLVYSGAALLLLFAIMRTFDRCMGRVTWTGERPLTRAAVSPWRLMPPM